MSAVPDQLFGRRCSLLLLDGDDEALDLSELRVQFETRQEDEESPNNASIRVENLGPDIVAMVQESYDRVVLQAGYWGAPFGVIFQGEIKQFRKGRQDQKTTFLDILAADGDKAYNYALLRQTLAAGSTPAQRVQAAIGAMAPHGVQPGQVSIPNTGGVLPRGKVLFGLASASLREIVRDQGCTWNIQDGKVNVTPLDSYMPGEAVVLNSRTGLIGRAQQTENGVRCRCLINPRIVVGGLVQIDEKSVNQTQASASAALPVSVQPGFPVGQLPFDRYAGVQLLADVAADGLYRVYVAEATGDTRGQDWYMDLVLLAVNPVTSKVVAK